MVSSTTMAEASYSPQCPRCKQGAMSKQALGWTCESCGFAPFADRYREKPLVPSAAAPNGPTSLPPTLADAGTETPPRVLFSTWERKLESLQVDWGETGGGAYFASRVPLPVVPPGEPIPVQVVAYNPTPTPLALEYRVVVRSKLGGFRLYEMRSGDIPPNCLLDATYPVRGTPGPEECTVLATCRAIPTTGQPQDPAAAPQLQEAHAPPSAPMPPPRPSGDVSFRSSLECPRCARGMSWSPGNLTRTRAWVCGACEHRIESGTLA
ncbi:MAG: hypothetical protein KGJ23_07340 [Euryarchaeota archaeon]|nr:hypothetical protein [Euryarchaeota archaeon]MDE2044162.1 hypothetical protein [Thermoplasmata archaeon]